MADSDIIKSIAFPFNLGQSSFPDVVYGADAVKHRVVALVLTGRNERVMHPNVGTNLHQFIFDDLNPFAFARMQADVARTISENEPDAVLISVDVAGGQDENSENTFVIDAVWSVSGQLYQASIPTTP